MDFESSDFATIETRFLGRGHNRDLAIFLILMNKGA